MAHTPASPQAPFEQDPLVDHLLAAVGNGSLSCSFACGTARSAVYSCTNAKQNLPRSLAILAKCGSWGEWPNNTVSFRQQCLELMLWAAARRRFQGPLPTVKPKGKVVRGSLPPPSPMERLDPDNYGFPARPNQGNY